MKTLVVFGVQGQLGTAVAKIFSGDFKVVGLSHAEADITDAAQVAAVFAKYAPQVAVNAAAYNLVEQVEENLDMAYKLNAFGPFLLAREAKKHNAVLVHFSTDYVFDGEKEFFTERDCPHPINAYGASKLAGEQLIGAVGGNHYIIRTTALFGESGNSGTINFVDRIIAKARAGEEVKVVSDQFTCPTLTSDLAAKIKQLVLGPAPLGVYHITNQGSCSWYDYALKIIELAALKLPVRAISTSESGTKIRRQKYSILKNERLGAEHLGLLPQWPEALARYLAQKTQK